MHSNPRRAAGRGGDPPPARGPAGDMYDMLWDGTESVKLAERNNAAASLALFRFTGIAPVGGADVYNYDLVCPASAVTAL